MTDIGSKFEVRQRVPVAEAIGFLLTTVRFERVMALEYTINGLCVLLSDIFKFMVEDLRRPWVLDRAMRDIVHPQHGGVVFELKRIQLITEFLVPCFSFLSNHFDGFDQLGSFLSIYRSLYHHAVFVRYSS